MAAWKRTFDEFLRARDPGAAEFTQLDYNRYVDGKQRADGVRTFLASRGITLPDGSPDDPPTAGTVNGIGNRKNVLVLERIAAGHVQVYPGSVRYLEAARAAGLRRAVVSASANCRDVLRAARIEHMLEERVDGVVARELGLPGK